MGFTGFMATALGVLCLVACVAPVERLPGRPLGVPFIPPPHYRALWDSAQACTGRTGDYARVLWYEMPGNSFTSAEHLGYADGEWFPKYGITIAHEYRTTDWLIKHEMIHVLLQRGHTEKDRIATWGTKCHATRESASPDSTYRP